MSVGVAVLVLQAAAPVEALDVAPSQPGAFEIKNRAAQAWGARHTALALAAAANPYIYVPIPNCPGNNINTGVDAPCQQAVDACPPGEVMMQFHRGRSTMTIGQPGWVHIKTECTSGAEPGTPTPGFTLADFQRLPLPAGTAQVEPPSEHVLIRMPTNVYALPVDPTLLATTSLGLDIEVRATPTRWSWDFGDGFVLGPTTQPGGPWPALTNAHPYAERGTYEITMTTHYTGEYSVEGGPWLPVPGEARVQSPPVTKIAIAGEAKLVDEPLN